MIRFLEPWWLGQTLSVTACFGFVGMLAALIRVGWWSAPVAYALTAVFLLALSEAIPVIGTVVPGSTLIVGISALAAGANVNPWLLLVAATVGAIAGDGLSFWLGQRYHREILLGWPLNRYPRFIDRSEAFINRYGVASVFLARFTAVVRAFVPLVAGILRMSPRQFYADVFPGVLLAMAISLAGASTEQLTCISRNSI